jgi:hypothetical protein
MKVSTATALICGLMAGGVAGFALVRAGRPASPPPPPPPPPVARVEQVSASEASAALASWRPQRVTPDAAQTAVAAWLAKTGAPAERLETLRALLLVLPNEALLALLDGLLKEPAKPSGPLRQLAFDVWAERAPEGAARWAAEQRTGDQLSKRTKENWCRQAGVEWSRRDFASAYAWGSALGDAALAETLAGRMLDVLAERDPHRALELAEARGDAFARDMQQRILDVWAKRDPAEAVRTLGPAMLANGVEFWRMGTEVRAWMRQDPEAALRWLNEQPRLAGKNGIEHACDDLIVKSEQPAAMADRVAAMTELTKRTEILANAIGDWGVAQPEAAGAWLAGLKDDVLRADILGRITRSYSTEAPEKSLPFALNLPAGPERKQWTAMLLGAWAKNDAAAAQAWLGTQTDPDALAASPAIQVPLLDALAKTAPMQAATQWSALPEGQAKNEALNRIAESWAATDPEAALRWFGTQLAAGTMQANTALETAFYPWSQKDPDAALAWAEAQPAEVRNVALWSLSGDIHGDRPSPSKLAGVLAKIKDPVQRVQLLGIHLEAWLRANRPAAREWIETHDVLPAEQAAKLLLAAGAVNAVSAPKN